MNLNSKHALKIHGDLITKRWFLNKLYSDFYKELKSVRIPNGKRVEIGSGAGFIKKIIPDAITSDVIKGENVDRVFSSTKIPFKNKEVSAFYMLNVLHHIKDPALALKEMERSLKKGGKIIMIEPWPTVWSRFIYQNFHHEDFNVSSDWRIEGIGRMSDANGALPWILFKRDINKFKKLFPNLRLTKIELHTPFKYIISGGLSKPQLLPTFCYPLVDLFEKLISPLNNYLALFATIVITKKK